MIGSLSPKGGLGVRGKTFGQKKSSFSKKSSKSAEMNDSDHGSEKKLPEDLNSYLYKINGDFDRRKQYEETVLRIMNEMCRTKITEPDGHDQFGDRYQNTSIHKRTIFIDLDDTLVYASVFKLHDADDKSD